MAPECADPLVQPRRHRPAGPAAPRRPPRPGRGELPGGLDQTPQPPVVLPADAVTSLQDAIEANPELRVTVDLAGREVRAGEPPLLTAALQIADYTRWRLMEGLDDISLTLRHADAITRYEQDRPAWLPVAG